MFLRPIVCILSRDVDGGIKRASVWCPSREKYHKLLHEVLKPEAKLQRAGRGEVEERHFNMNSERKLSADQRRALPSDVQEVIVGEEHQQEWSSSLDQEDTKPPHIKEEQGELQISQNEEQLQGLEEADITKFPFTLVPVKSEDDEEKPQFSQLHQRQTEEIKTAAGGEDCGGPEAAMKLEEQEELRISQDEEQLQGLEEADITKFPFTLVPVKSEDDEEKPMFSKLHQRQTEEIKTEAGGEDCGGPEPALKSDPDTHLQPATDDQTGDSSEPETDDSDEETREPQSGLNSLNNDRFPVSESRCTTDEKEFSCSECGKIFGTSTNLKRHMRTHKGEKAFSCSECGKRFVSSINLKIHMRSHTGEKPFTCSVCKKAFTLKQSLKRHMRSHTGEKPFSCSVCKKAFTESGHLQTHMRIHTGEKPFSCSVCKKDFVQSGNLQAHMRIHTGETPFICSLCKKAFTMSGSLKRHMRIHTGEKPFICSVCKKAFTESGSLKTHMRIHTGEKPFSCSVCRLAFTDSGNIQKHMRIHTGEKPFSCSVCKKAFTDSGNLQKHMKIHT